MKLKKITIPLVIVVLVALFYWPTFRWLVQSWLSNSYYTHGFLVPLITGFFIWTKRHELKTREPSIIGAFVLALGALVYIIGFVWDMRFLSAISLMIVLSGVVFLFFGTRAMRSIVFPLCFLIFMIPLPFIQEIGFYLQTISVHSSAWLLTAVGLPVTTIGPEIHLGDVTFTIGLPCSGINTLIALLALAAVYVYLLTGPFYKRAILFVSAFPLAILANVLRIASIILVANSCGEETAMGWFHDLSSPLFFIIAFLCLVLIGRLLRCRLRFHVLRK
jgi:exosortase